MLTITERLEGYKYALDRLDKEYGDYDSTTGPFLCNLLMDYYKENHNIHADYIDDDLIVYNFPELQMCKPKNARYGWWNCEDEDILIRTVVLQWCIDSLTSKK